MYWDLLEMELVSCVSLVPSVTLVCVCVCVCVQDGDEICYQIGVCTTLHKVYIYTISILTQCMYDAYSM